MTERLRRAAQIVDNVMAYFESDDEEFASNLRADICGAMAYAEQAEREGCARVLEGLALHSQAAAIRARGQGQAEAAE